MTLCIEKLSKAYPNGVKALDQVGLHIGKGLFGLLGPNGAGKSSLMRTIATLQSPDSGQITFEDINVLRHPMALRRLLGYLPQEFGVYPGISAERLLDYLAKLKGLSYGKERRAMVQHVLEITNLYEVRHQKVAGYSGGMKRRFGIAQLLLNQPRLIIVDEPTAGLDPAERVRFLNLLREIGNQATVIFSTHIVADVKTLCREVAIMNRGKILTKDTPEKVASSLKGKVWKASIPRTEMEAILARHTVLYSRYHSNQAVEIKVTAAQRPSPKFVPAPPELEDAYFLTVGKDHPMNISHLAYE